MKTITYKDSQVAQGSHLYDLLMDKKNDLAEKHYLALNQEFMKVWGAYPHLINYKVGNGLPRSQLKDNS